MSKLLLALSVVGAATGTLATRLIWTLLADPTTMAAALGSGSLRVVVSALLGLR
jgi:hypothetical protein